MKARDSHTTPAPTAVDDIPPDANAPAPEVTQQVMQDGAKFSSLMKHDPVTPSELRETVEADAGSMPAMPSLARFDKPASNGAPDAAPSLALTPTQLRERAMHRKALGLDSAAPRKSAKGSHAATVKHETHDEKQVIVDAGAATAIATPTATTTAAPVVIKAESKHGRSTAVSHVVASKVIATQASDATSAPHEAPRTASSPARAEGIAGDQQAERPHAATAQTPAHTAQATQHRSPATPAKEAPVEHAEAADDAAPAARTTQDIARPGIATPTNEQPATAQRIAASTDSAPMPRPVEGTPRAEKTEAMDIEPVDASGEMPEPMRQEKRQEVAQERVAQELGAQVMAQQVHLNQVNTTPQDSPLVEIIKEL